MCCCLLVELCYQKTGARLQHVPCPFCVTVLYVFVFQDSMFSDPNHNLFYIAKELVLNGCIPIAEFGVKDHVSVKFTIWNPNSIGYKVCDSFDLKCHFFLHYEIIALPVKLLHIHLMLSSKVTLFKTLVRWVL